MASSRFRWWEILLIVSMLFLFAGSAAVYFSGIELRVLLLGMKSQGVSKSAGKVSLLKGSVKRKVAQRPDFTALLAQGDVYDSDLIVTGADSSVEVVLNDGSKIELGSQTMVRISFQALVSFTGLSKTAEIEVVSGQVSGSSNESRLIFKNASGDTIEVPKNAGKISAQVAPPIPGRLSRLRQTEGIQEIEKPAPSPRPSPPPKPSPVPSPTPSPKRIPPPPPPIEIRSEALPPASLQIPLGSASAEVKAPFRFVTSDAKQPMQFEIFRNQETQPVLQQKITWGASKKASLDVPLKRPGKYRWALKTPAGRKSKPGSAQNGQFEVAAPYAGIVWKPVLITGKAALNNRIIVGQRSEFIFESEWSPVKEAKEYQFSLFKAGQEGKPWLEQKTTQPKFSKLFEIPLAGEYVLHVHSVLPSGFVAQAPALKIKIDFSPSILIAPGTGEVLKKEKVDKDDFKQMFSWTKTEFTEQYWLELASDAEFKKIRFTEKLAANFFLMGKLTPPLAVGKYWWRVRSVNHEVISPSSEVRTLEVK